MQTLVSMTDRWLLNNPSASNKELGVALGLLGSDSEHDPLAMCIRVNNAHQTPVAIRASATELLVFKNISGASLSRSFPPDFELRLSQCGRKAST